MHAHRYPVWASLARDHLAIMASSVSSERAFSSAGITISKHRNRLKGDVVEALQFMKCLLRRNLVFRENPTELLKEDLMDEEECLLDSEKSSQKIPSWDEEYLLDYED